MKLACAGVILQLLVSGNLLTWIGIPYVSDGGSLLLKIHPASYLFGLAGVAALYRRGDPVAAAWRAVWAEKPVAVFLGCMGFCAVHALVMTGCGTLIVFVDTFLPAGFLALAAGGASEAERRMLLRVLNTGIALNAALALAEGLGQFRTIPLYLNGQISHAGAGDFRPTAFYDHPLTGAAVTMIGLLLLAARPGQGPKGITHFLLLASALLAFGGRTAAALMLAAGAWWIGRGACRALLRRQGLPAAALIAAACSALALPALTMVALWTGFGTRLLSHLYWDSSADVRLLQWDVLGMLRSDQLIFGTSRADLLALLTPLRLQSGVGVIENFWLLMFLYLGVTGFPVFVTGFAALLAWCVRQAGSVGLLLVGSVIVAASGSNSLGRKSNLLVLLTAAAIAAGGAPVWRRRSARFETSASQTIPLAA